MKKPLQVAASALSASGLLWVSDRFLQPVPIPAGTAVLGGLLPLWLGSRKTWVAIGAVVGTMLGLAVHAVVHITGGSTLPPEGVPLHVTADGALGFVVAVFVLTAVIVVRSFIDRVTLPRGGAGGGIPDDA